jgi:hypothetical protein
MNTNQDTDCRGQAGRRRIVFTHLREQIVGE